MATTLRLQLSDAYNLPQIMELSSIHGMHD